MTQNLAEERMQLARDALTHVAPVPSGTEPGGLPLRKLFNALFRARMFLILTAGLGLLIGSFMAITTPNTYVSQGMFAFGNVGSETINLDPTRSSESELGTIASRAIHVLTAERLLRRVIERLTPERILAPYEPEDEHSTGISAVLHRIQRDWNAADVSGATVDDAMIALRRRLNISKPRGSDVLIATYTAHNRKLAQEVLAAYMDEAPKFHQGLYDSPKVYEEIRKGAEAAELARENAQLALRRFLEEEVKIQSGFEFELESRRMRETESAAEYEKNQRDVASLRLQLVQLEKRLETTPPTRKVEVRRDASAAESVLYGRIADLDNEILLTANAETRKQLQRQRAELVKLVEDAQRRASEAPPVWVTEANPQFAQLQADISELRTEQLKATAITEKLKHDHASDHKELGRLLDLEQRYRQLRDTLSRAEVAQNQSANAFATAETKRQLQAANFSSLQDIGAASYPLEKEGPNRSKLVLGGLVVGMFLGLGLVVMKALPDSTVREPADLEKLDGLAVIGMMPSLDGKHVRRHEATRVRGG